MNTYTYRYKDAIYINLTNRCTNDCTFCVRNNHDGVGGYHLQMDSEPNAKDIIEQLEKQDDVSKIVFCGLGEPTMSLDVLLNVARYLKKRGSHIRINTNGQANAYAKQNIATRLVGLIDVVSISLNAPNAAEYQKYCRSVYGEDAYAHMLDFAKACIAEGIDTVMSVVDVIGDEKVEQSRKIAQDIGARFRIRKYVE
ncbi:MAG: radical SAM protein [Clostridia bacterium]|jgi:TatD family-associated radical SAM protein|nr:radical SAM protein [Clostridia bacterium]MBT7121725.1 radical SAM protein [Clostridia bacterium]